jgi:hypothetical protein
MAAALEFTIPEIPTTATTPAADDYLELGGNANGSRKILGSSLGAYVQTLVRTPGAAYGAGTAYTLTNTAAALVFGTTSPNLTLTESGTYLVFGHVQLAAAGATVVAETATLKLRRTNNTAADVSSSSILLDLPVSTTLTHTLGVFALPPVVYVTTNADDVLSIFANVSAALGAGTITAIATGTSLVAVRIK